MSGYDGNPDSGAEAALEHVDNLVHASRTLLQGPILTHCRDCNEPIADARRNAAMIAGIKCCYCIECQGSHDKGPKIKMLTHIL